MTLLDSDDLRNRIASPEQTASRSIMEHAMAFGRSAVLLSAHDLGLFDVLAQGPLAPDEVACKLGLRADSVVDLLEAVATLGLVERSGPVYRNTCLASAYLDSSKPAYMGRWMDMARSAMQAMANLSAELRTSQLKPDARSALAERMWGDIAEILGSAFPDDRV